MALLAALTTLLSLSSVSADESNGAGAITGTVRDWNGSPLADIYVEIVQDGYYVDGAFTNSSGAYSMSDVAEGTGYTARFLDWTNENRVAREWYSDASSSIDAATFDVADGSTLTIDAALDPPATISGVVRDASGQPVEGLSAEAEHADGGCCDAYGTTNSAGEFSIEGLAEADYHIQIGFSGTGPYAVEWYDDVPFEQQVCGATPDIVSVARGGTTSGLEVVVEAPITTAVPTGPPPSDWLGVLNWYRTSSGLTPVMAEVPCWSDGLAAHLTYLEMTPAELLWPNAHHENPESPYYTPEGAAAGRTSVLAYTASSERDAIDIWMQAPFHATGLLKPDLWWSAFARSSSNYAGLTTGRGTVNSPDIDQPTLFPGDGANVAMTRFRGESPDPMESCPDFAYGSLPLIAMLPESPSPEATASIKLPTGETLLSETGDVCIVSEHTYVSTNPTYGATGLSVLQNRKALFLIIEKTLEEGQYDVTLDAGSGLIEWSFNVIEAPGLVANLTGTRGAEGNVTIEWDPPVEDGGSPIASYSVVIDGTEVIVDGATTHLDYVDPDPSAGVWVEVLARTAWYPDGGDIWPASVYVEPVATPPPPGALFVDDDGSIFEPDIEWMAQAGITKGCNPPVNDRFCPDDNVTRGQMAAFLVRALGLTAALDDPFGDDDGSVFEADIEKLAAAGITRGCNPPVNDMFCPGSSVTRGQMAAFLVRALGYSDAGAGDLFIDDDDSVFEGDIDRLGTAGVTRGCNPPSQDMFCPDSFVSRAQMAAFLHRALG